MHIQDIDIIRPQLPETISDRDEHAFYRISREIALKWLFLHVITPITSRVLRRNKHLVPVSTLLHPFAN